MAHEPPLPAVFGGFFAPYPEHRLNVVGATFTQCFGCGPTHPTGLRVRAFVAAGGVLSPILIPAVYAGPPRAAHGGIVAAYLDEICGAAAMSRGRRIYVTAELSVRYLKPTPVETPLLGRGRVVEDHDRYVDVEASLEEFEGGHVVASATARFVPLRPR